MSLAQMAESGTIVSCPLLRLPVELCQQIATSMTLRDWAQVSGVCKTLWRLPLLEVKITAKDQYPTACDHLPFPPITCARS